MLRRTLFVLAIALGLNASSASAAPIILDDYTVVDSGSTGGSGSFSNPPLSVGMLSGGNIFRDISGKQTTGGPGSGTINIGAGTVVFGSSGSGTTFELTIAYSFNSTNFTGMDGLLNVHTIDPQGLGSIPLSVTLVNNGVATTLPTIPISATGPLEIPFGATPRNQVTDIILTFTLRNNQDLILDADEGGFVIEGDPIPEPMTLATFGALALAGGYVARRRLKGEAVAAA